MKNIWEKHGDNMNNGNGEKTAESAETERINEQFKARLKKAVNSESAPDELRDRIMKMIRG